ncbi:MAG: hypothetical protein WC466_04150 [Candidatus Izemoplasmatales bacterium]
MNSKNNIFSKYFAQGTYECSSNDVNKKPQEFICIQNGTITIWPIKGDKFIWNAQTGKKIKVIASKIDIDSGGFVGLFPSLKSHNLEEDIEYYYLIDENEDNFIDENAALFQIK